MIGMHIVLPYWQEHRRGLETAAAELGVEAVFTGVSDNNALRQVEVFNQVLQANPAGILVSPIDPEAMKGPINEAVARGIPVICFDSDSPDSDRLMYIGTNNYESGQIAGRLIAESLGGPGDVGILTIPGLYSMDQRQKGFEDYFRDSAPWIRVAAVGTDDADPYRAVSVTNQMLEEHPEIRGLFCVNAAGGVGASIALKEKGMLGDITVVSFDKDAAILDLVEQGDIQATLVQRTFAMSYYGVKFLYDYNHRRVGINEESISSMPVNVDTGVIIVTKENLNQFR